MSGRELGMTRKDLEAMLGGRGRVQEWGHSEFFISAAYRLAEENPLIPPHEEKSIWRMADSLPSNFSSTRRTWHTREFVLDPAHERFCGLGI